MGAVGDDDGDAIGVGGGHVGGRLEVGRREEAQDAIDEVEGAGVAPFEAPDEWGALGVGGGVGGHVAAAILGDADDRVAAQLWRLVDVLDGDSDVDRGDGGGGVGDGDDHGVGAVLLVVEGGRGEELAALRVDVEDGVAGDVERVGECGGVAGVIVDSPDRVADRLCGGGVLGDEAPAALARGEGGRRVGGGGSRADGVEYGRGILVGTVTVGVRGGDAQRNLPTSAATGV